jgi:microcystin-dependent protein
MSQDYIGNVVLAGFNFAPRGYLPCDGRLLAIAQNTALFSLLGTTYGGNGTTNYALPDLRGRAAVGSTGTSTVVLGEQGGAETVALQTSHLPSHTHALRVQSGLGSTGVPGSGVVLAQSEVDDGTPLNSYSSAAHNTTLASASIGATGLGSAVRIRNPYLGLNYFICVNGVFPVRN